MDDSRFQLLVVCTANICRSVMAEQMLEHEASERGLALDVSSCGFLFDGEGATEPVTLVLAERDLDATGHVSRKFSPDLVDGVDLVVTMERMHAREIAVAVPGLSARVHTLGALVGVLGDEEIAQGNAGERIAAAAAMRETGDLLGFGPDEVDDPHGRSNRVHRQTANQIAQLCTALLDGLFGAVET